MFVLGLFSHPHWIISKIQATPTWLFYCLAMFFPLFGIFYWLTDVKGKASWFNIIKTCGTATLTCYVIPYLWYSIQQLLEWYYPHALYSGIPGLLKSLVYSLIIVIIAGLLAKVKIKLKNIIRTITEYEKKQTPRNYTPCMLRSVCWYASKCEGYRSSKRKHHLGL